MSEQFGPEVDEDDAEWNVPTPPTQASAARLTAIANSPSPLYVHGDDLREDARAVLAQIDTLRQEQARLDAEAEQSLEEYKEVSRTSLAAIAEAEQQRDAALAALKKLKTAIELVDPPAGSTWLGWIDAALHPNTGNSERGSLPNTPNKAAQQVLAGANATLDLDAINPDFARENPKWRDTGRAKEGE